MEGNIESVIAKEELKICHGCLSSDRNLMALGENTELFIYLLGSDDVENPTSMFLCWECSAILRNMRRFQQKIQRAQDIMQLSLDQEEYFCLSKLTRNTRIETYSNIDIMQKHSNNQEHETNSRNKIDSFVYQDILNKQPVVILEKIEVRYEDEYYSHIDIEDVDMESVLREKEECLNNITLNRTSSPSCTRDSSITAGPLQKKTKSNNDNKTKTEEKTDVTNTERVKEKATEVQGGPNELFSCNICGKVLKTEYYLNVHYKTHRPARVFECDICKKTFSRKHCLIDHLRIHTGERPYVCKVCHKRFTQCTSLRCHLMTHTGEKPFSCEICGKRFYRQGKLKTHLITHTSEKPYNCTVCDKRFKQKEYLKKHLRSHLSTHLRPYSCEICYKRFNQKPHLKLHLLTHTGDKPFSCEICNKRLKYNASLKVHLRTHL